MQAQSNQQEQQLILRKPTPAELQNAISTVSLAARNVPDSTKQQWAEGVVLQIQDEVSTQRIGARNNRYI